MFSVCLCNRTRWPKGFELKISGGVYVHSSNCATVMVPVTTITMPINWLIVRIGRCK